MARIRSIKPEFWTDGAMVALSVWARLFYVGTWNFSCDRGHLPDDPIGLKLKILPADDVDAAALIAELLHSGRLVRRRTSDGRPYLFIPRLGDHQKLDPRWKSRCPHCTEEESGGFTEDSPRLTETQPSPPEPTETPATSAQDGIGVDGIGVDVPPTAGTSLTLVAADTPTTQSMIAEWIAHCAKRPPASVVAQVGKQLKAMLGEGIDPDDVRAGLAAWHQKGLHPSALASVVNELMNGGRSRASPRQSTTDARFNAGLALGEQFDRLESGS